ncbi:MAG: hypothetical protein OEM29_09115 [Thermoplasmata archaeon]|nr:hypothetical protein [Thermoplasmata archaeon]
MRKNAASAIAIAVLFGATAFACVVGAEDEGEPLIITQPSGTVPMSCAVFFADNMVYGPQWRIGNFVRIEAMVLNMDDYDSAKDLTVSDTDLYPSVEYPDGLSQQAAINGDSENVLPMTKMVSVEYIQMVITGPSYPASKPYILEAGWNKADLTKVVETNGLGREVNKAGHVIYGCLWDTTGLIEGTYTVTTKLGVVQQLANDKWIGVPGSTVYSVDYAICHLYIAEDVYVDLDHPYADLAGDEDDIVYETFKNGIGNVTDGAAWIELGQLIPQGSGGGNGGNGNGGEGGNGNGGENGGNGGGNGNGGRRSRGK